MNKLFEENLNLAKHNHNFKHGLSHHRLHRLWCGMRARCNNPDKNMYNNYGGRGIKVCQEWLEFTPFYNWAMANGYSDTLTIDRKDNDGNYCPENCKWSTNQEQQRNKRNNVLIEIDGITDTLKGWSERIGIPYSTLHRKYHKDGKIVLFGGKMI